MDVGLGMRLRTRDDREAGSVDQLILDPGTAEVRAIVLRKGTIVPREVEVPMGALEVESDGAVRLACTADQLGALPPFVTEQ
jgi:PRC-barrel domain protein